MASIGVVIATYGDLKWAELANARARVSVERQTIYTPSIHAHTTTLAMARNVGAEDIDTEWLIFLDADDELHPAYVEAMADALALLDEAGDFLLQPAIQYVDLVGSTSEPYLIPARPSLRELNHMVIGTMVRHSTFEAAGGFWEEPAWEDWSLWLRCTALGAIPTPVPGAIYRAHQSSRGRNSGIRRPQRLKDEILATHDRWLKERGLA